MRISISMMAFFSLTSAVAAEDVAVDFSKGQRTIIKSSLDGISSGDLEIGITFLEFHNILTKRDFPFRSDFSISAFKSDVHGDEVSVRSSEYPMSVSGTKDTPEMNEDISAWFTSNLTQSRAYIIQRNLRLAEFASRDDILKELSEKYKGPPTDHFRDTYIWSYNLDGELYKNGSRCSEFPHNYSNPNNQGPKKHWMDYAQAYHDAGCGGAIKALIDGQGDRISRINIDIFDGTLLYDWLRADRKVMDQAVDKANSSTPPAPSKPKL